MSPPVIRHVGRIGPTARWSMSRHQHGEHHEIIVVLAGQIEVRFPAVTVVGHAGDVLFYCRDQAHEERALCRLETVFIAFTYDAPRLGAWQPMVHDRLGRISTLARWIHEAHPHPPAPSLLAAILHEYEHLQRSPENELLRRIKQHVREHLHEPLRLEDLAGVACLSKFHFARIFREAEGVSPMRYVRQCRIEAARSLLATTPMPLRAIAPLVGLPDAAELARTFRRLTGQTTRELRPR